MRTPFPYLLLVITLGLVPVALLANDPPSTLPRISVALPDSALPSSPGYHSIHVTVACGRHRLPMAVGLFLPPLYFKSRDPFPILVSLHNRGYKGDDGNSIPHEGMASLWANDDQDDRDSTAAPPNAIVLRKTARFIGIAPGLPDNYDFEHAPMPQIISELIGQIQKAYRTDEQRVYLTGFSYGGSCTWCIAEQFPRQYAAIVPISARATDNPALTSKALRDVPVFLACGTDEWALPECRRMRDALQAAKHPNFKYHEIPGGTHWCYGTIYTDPKFWDWLLAQKRAATATTRPADGSTAKEY